MFIAAAIVGAIVLGVFAISWYEFGASQNDPYGDDGIDDWGPTFLGDVETEDYDQT